MKYVLSACFTLLFFVQSASLIGFAQSDTGLVIDGVQQDPIEPTEPELVELDEDEYLKYFKACAEMAEDGEPLPDYEDYAEEQGAESGILSGWLDTGIVHAAGASGSADVSLSGETPFVDYDANFHGDFAIYLKNLMQDYFGTSSGGSGGGSHQRTSFTIPKYYNFKGKTVIQYPSELREQVILSLSFISGSDLGTASGTFSYTRVFNGVTTVFDGRIVDDRSPYSGEALPKKYTKTVNANIPQLTSTGYIMYEKYDDAPYLYATIKGNDKSWLYQYPRWFFAGTGIFQAYLNTTTRESLTNLEVLRLSAYVNSGLPVYTINMLNTNDFSVYQTSVNNQTIYKQWNYPITYNDTFVGGDTISTENITNYYDYGLTLVTGGDISAAYLDFDPQLFLDHLADIEAQLKLNYERVYEQLPEPEATYEHYDGTYYYPYATEQEVPATSSGGGSGGDVNVNVNVTLEYETFSKISTEHYEMNIDNVDDFDLTQIPESAVRGTNGILALFTYLCDETGLLPYFLALLGVSLLISFIL